MSEIRSGTVRQFNFALQMKVVTWK